MRARWIAVGLVSALVVGAAAYIIQAREGLEVTVDNETSATLTNVRVGIGESWRYGVPPDVAERPGAVTFPPIEPGGSATQRLVFDGEASLIFSFDLDGVTCTERGSYVEGTGYAAEIVVQGCDRVGVGVSTWP